MICRASYFRDTDNYKDTPLAVIGVDEQLIKVMKGAIILEIKDTADHFRTNMSSDDYTDAVNYIQDLTGSLRELDKALCTIIDVQEAEEVAEDE